MKVQVIQSIKFWYDLIVFAAISAFKWSWREVGLEINYDSTGKGSCKNLRK